MKNKRIIDPASGKDYSAIVEIEQLENGELDLRRILETQKDAEGFELFILKKWLAWVNRYLADFVKGRTY